MSRIFCPFAPSPGVDGKPDPDGAKRAQSTENVKDALFPRLIQIRKRVLRKLPQHLRRHSAFKAALAKHQGHRAARHDQIWNCPQIHASSFAKAPVFNAKAQGREGAKGLFPLGLSASLGLLPRKLSGLTVEWSSLSVKSVKSAVQFLQLRLCPLPFLPPPSIYNVQ